MLLQDRHLPQATVMLKLYSIDGSLLRTILIAIYTVSYSQQARHSPIELQLQSKLEKQYLNDNITLLITAELYGFHGKVTYTYILPYKLSF